MRVQSLTIQNYGPFVQPQQITFQPGCRLVVGDNQVNPRLEGAAVGKSKLWEAVVWGLYGIGFDQQGPSVVTIGIEREGINFVIRRTPDSLTVCQEGSMARKALQKNLDEFLGFNAHDFIASSLISSHSPDVVKYSPLERYQYFCELPTCRDWYTVRDKAHEYWCRLNREPQPIEVEIIRATTRLGQSSAKLLQVKKEAPDSVRVNHQASKVKQVENTIKRLENKLRTKQLVIQGVEYWQDRLHHVQSWCVQELLHQVSEIATRYLDLLGLEHWKVCLNVVPSSMITTYQTWIPCSYKEYAVELTVTNLRCPEGLKVPACSSLELDRLRVAIQAAVLDMQRGVGVEVWDDLVFDACLQEFLQQRAITSNKAILAIPRHSCASGASCFRVVADVNGSFIR